MSGDRHPRESRPLSADDDTLWTTVTRAVKPLRPAPKLPTPSGEPSRSPEPKRTRDTVSGTRVATRHPEPPPLAPLERRLRQRLGRGSASPDRRLDLHGMTQRQAHDALLHFLHTAQADGVKLVLVVTGKGARSADRDPFVERGVLRRLVPQWLNATDLRRLVVGFDSAHVGHGGDGALYVRIRRPRG